MSAEGEQLALDLVHQAGGLIRLDEVGDFRFLQRRAQLSSVKARSSQASKILAGLPAEEINAELLPVVMQASNDPASPWVSAFARCETKATLPEIWQAALAA